MNLFLDSLLGKFYRKGAPVPLRAGLNFGPGFALTPSPLGYDVSIDPAVYVEPRTVVVVTTNAVPTAQPSAAIDVPERTFVRVEMRVRGWSGPPYEGYNDSLTILGASFRRQGLGALAQWGATDMPVNEKSNAGWGTPSFSIVGNSIVPVVTGEATSTIYHTIETVVRAY